jgi:hypothetical protein
MEINVIKR